MPESESVSLLASQSSSFTPTPLGEASSHHNTSATSIAASSGAPPLEGRISPTAYRELLLVVSAHDIVYACSPKWTLWVRLTVLWLLALVGAVLLVALVLVFLVAQVPEPDFYLIAIVLLLAFGGWTIDLFYRLWKHNSSYLALTVDDLLISNVRGAEDATTSATTAARSLTGLCTQGYSVERIGYSHINLVTRSRSTITVHVAGDKKHSMEGVKDAEWVESFISANMHRTVVGGGQLNLDSVLMNAYQQTADARV